MSRTYWAIAGTIMLILVLGMVGLPTGYFFIAVWAALMVWLSFLLWADGKPLEARIMLLQMAAGWRNMRRWWS